MNFLWPWILIFLLIVPLIVGIYIWILRRKRKYAVRYASLMLIREALPKRSKWRQHFPFALFLSGLALLITAASRPIAEVEVPLSNTTIILALDSSRSMCATDISPNRLTAAQEAALAFIESQAENTKIGVVAFAGFAEIIIPPTTDKDMLKDGVKNLTTSFGTAIGSATLKAIDAIAEINNVVAPSGVNLRTGETPLEHEEGFYVPDIIVLLTDGANSRGPLPVDAAHQASDRGIRVYTIGFGTTNPTEMVCSPNQLGSDSFRDFDGGGFGGGGFGGGFGGGGGGFRRFLLLDEPTLKAVAETTGGKYFKAESAGQLLDVFVNLPSQIVLQKEKIEISVIFSAIGAIFAALAVALSLLWNRFP